VSGAPEPAAVGDRIPVEVRGPVHGGHCLAHIPGDDLCRTVFLRHGLPGEHGEALVTAVAAGGRRIFADLVRVDAPSPDRVPVRCPAAGPAGCGGCDLQHVSGAGQRAWKAAVIADALRRTGGFAQVPWDGAVEAVPGDEDGLRWRTRGRFLVAAGQLAMQRHRTQEPVPVADCPITAAPVVAAARGWAEQHPGAAGVWAMATADGVLAGPDPRAGQEPGSARGPVVEHGGRQFRVASFWQVHPGAPTALVAAVLQGAGPVAGADLLDLYGGVGLFAAAFADAGARRVDLVEGDRTAVELARGNLAGLPVRCHRSGVEPWLRRWHHRPATVVLDPPRSGAGRTVMRQLARLAPARIVYVACDPVAMARDLAEARAGGYRLARLRAFDLFPMTAHVECVATLEPAAR
jgi:tRNA/tmRNA/rRNA uracil-C5-methylase (TrmA/RlmC/RlmD family)